MFLCCSGYCPGHYDFAVDQYNAALSGAWVREHVRDRMQGLIDLLCQAENVMGVEMDYLIYTSNQKKEKNLE